MAFISVSLDASLPRSRSTRRRTAILAAPASSTALAAIVLVAFACFSPAAAGASDDSPARLWSGRGDDGGTTRMDAADSRGTGNNPPAEPGPPGDGAVRYLHSETFHDSIEPLAWGSAGFQPYETLLLADDPLARDRIEFVPFETSVEVDDPLGLGDDSPAEPAPSLDPPASTGSGAPAERPYWRTNFFKRIWKDQAPLFLHWWPSEFKRSDFSAPLGFTTLIAFQSSVPAGGGIDVHVADWAQAHCQGGCRSVANAFTTLGNVQTAVVGLGVTYFVSRWTHDERLYKATSLSAEALVSTGLYTEVIKGVFARLRPAGGAYGEFFNYGSPPPGQEAGSFPSGHATGAFAVATVFAHAYSDKKWVSWVAYSTATLIAASRVALHRHFPSDVIVGAYLGNSIGRFVLARSRGQAPPHGASAMLLHIRPIVDPAQRLYGASWDWSW